MKPTNAPRATERSSVALRTFAGTTLLALGMGCQATPATTAGASVPQAPATDGSHPAEQSATRGSSAVPTGGAAGDRVELKIAESGTGRNILVLHGGGGPGTTTRLAAHLAESAHVIAPTYPGWDGTPRPASLDSVPLLAEQYVHYLNEHDVKNVVVVGSSIGGWLGVEIALRDTAHRVAGLVIINGLGVDIPGQPITNVTGYTPQQLAKVAYHDPAKFGAGAPPPTPERIATMRANQATLAVFAGDPYSYDPTLLGRLKGLGVPTLVLWGASDHVVTKDYGRAYAAAIPNAKFETVAAAGHLPWLEQPAETFGAIDRFVAGVR